MSVSRLSKQSIQAGFPKQQTVWDQSTQTAAMDFLSIVNVNSAVSSITFNNIPQTYSHLQIRAYHQTTSSAESYGQFNGDTGANYKIHYMYGSGAGGYASGAGSAVNNFSFNYSGGTGSVFGVSITEILDYTSATKYKVTRSIGGCDTNGAGLAIVYSGLWMNQNPITSIKLFQASGNFAAYSSFGLYGIK